MPTPTPRNSAQSIAATIREESYARRRPHVVALIKAAEAARAEYMVSISDVTTWTDAMRASKGENRFDPAEVGPSFVELFAEVARVEFGHCGVGPVLVVELPFYPGQRTSDHGSIGEKYTPEERVARAQAVIDWAKSMRPDTITVYQRGSDDDAVPAHGRPGTHPCRVRLFWG